MITFKKINEVSEKIENFHGLLLIRQLSPDKDLHEFEGKEIIESVIKSKFHFWKGEEEPDGQTIQMSKTDSLGNLKNFTLTNHKFYGFFDNSKIHFSNYRLISKDGLIERIANLCLEWCDSDNSYEEKFIKLINKYINPLVSIYHLD